MEDVMRTSSAHIRVKVLRQLVSSLHTSLEPRIPPGLCILQPPVRDRARLRYDREGVRSATRTIILDLSPGARLRLSATHNCQVRSTHIHVCANFLGKYSQGCGQRRLRHILRPEPELATRGRVLSAVQRHRRQTGEVSHDDADGNDN